MNKLHSNLSHHLRSGAPRPYDHAVPLGSGIVYDRQGSARQLGNPELRLHCLVNRARWRQGSRFGH